MKKLLTILLVLCTLTASAQMRGGSQFDPGAVRSNLTNITSGSALGVANGGTGATTAAAGLAALGGASLNGSSTVAFNASIYNTATGTAAAPTYSFSSDPDTGIYSAGVNALGFCEGGAESMRIASGGNVLIATSIDDGANKLQVAGEVKFAYDSAGAFKTRYAATGADPATTTVFVGDLGTSNGDMVTVYMDIVGSKAGPGYEKFHVMIGAYNNNGTIVFVDAAPVVTSDISLGLGMSDPIITCEAAGTVITVKMTVLDAYSRVAINTTAAEYVRGVK